MLGYPGCEFSSCHGDRCVNFVSCFVCSCVRAIACDARRVSALCERRQLIAGRADRTSVCMRELVLLVRVMTRLRCCTYMTVRAGDNYETIHVECALHQRRKMAAASHVGCASAIICDHTVMNCDHMRRDGTVVRLLGSCTVG